MAKINIQVQDSDLFKHHVSTLVNNNKELISSVQRFVEVAGNFGGVLDGMKTYVDRCATMVQPLAGIQEQLEEFQRSSTKSVDSYDKANSVRFE